MKFQIVMKVIAALVNVTDTNQRDKTKLKSKSVKKLNIFQKPQHILLHINGQNLIKEKDGKAFLYYGNQKTMKALNFAFI